MWQCKADILRLEFLWHHGGMYVDADMISVEQPGPRERGGQRLGLLDPFVLGPTRFSDVSPFGWFATSPFGQDSFISSKNRFIIPRKRQVIK